MKRTTVVQLGVSVAVAVSAISTWLLTQPGAQHLFAGTPGRPRPDLAEALSFEVPLVAGLGLVICIAAIALLRTRREHRPNDVGPIATTTAAGILCLLVTHSFFARPAVTETELQNPKWAYEVFTSGEWQALAKGRWQGRELGPQLESDRGLRDFPGYLPYSPCLLNRLTFVDLSEERILNLLGRPRRAPKRTAQHLQYQMIDTSPRARIANLILTLDSTPDRGRYVILERIYPSRATADCD